MKRYASKRFFLLAALLALSVLSCRNPFLKDQDADEGRFGSLVINGQESRALLISEISSALVTVSGRGMGDITAETAISGGQASGVTIEGIPVGKNRIVTVEARRDSGGLPTKVDGVVLRAIVDIGSGENQASVNWASTALGNVFSALLSGGTDISAMEDADRSALSSFVSAVQGTEHALLVDASSIASDWSSGGMSRLETTGAPAYRIAPASLRFQPSPAGSSSAQVGDPASEKLASVVAGENLITGIVPGPWPFYLLSGEALVYRSDFGFLPGQETNAGTIYLQVPAPRFLPEDISFTTSVDVSLSCDLSGADIYYTLDGSEPAAAASATCFLYDGPFTLSQTTTIKAIASDGIILDSPVAEKTYLASVSDMPGVNHPSSGPYSPVDLNGDAAGMGWDIQTWELGARLDGADATFAVYSKNATRILLEIYASRGGEAALTDYWMEKGLDDVWRARVSGLPANSLYGFRAWGPNWPFDEAWRRGNSASGFLQDVDSSGNRFNPNKLLFDPYARELSHDKSNPEVLGSQNGGMYGTGDQDYQGVPRRNFDTGPWAPKAVIVQDATSFGTKPAIARKDAIIYEAHVRGITKHPSSASLATILSGLSGFEGVASVPEAYRGSYRGAAYLAPYLKALGITTIELLPVHETDNDHNPDDSPGGNYWGYMTFGYFAPDRRYAYDQSPGGPTREFKEMVKAFHDEGLEVYLDVVYNHSGEGGAWYGATDDYAAADSLFFRGLDNASYYSLVKDEPGAYWETTGCGNNLRCDNPPVRTLILDSLRYWLDEMGVDGFRFDLAPVLGRVYDSVSGNWIYDINALTLDAIQDLGAEKNAEMIAEAWDTGGGGYQVGYFPTGWGDWNGRYRDTLRGYMNFGSTASGGISYADAFHGDYANYYDGGLGGPDNSITFIVAHDGFTLADLVSYGSKTNETLVWPFGPSDGGSTTNISTDSGGDKALRRQRIRNYIAFLALSRGVPMIVYGDEFGRTQNGNNNPYNVDSVATWNNYGMIDSDSPQLEPTGGAGAYHDNLGTDGNSDGYYGNFLFTRSMLRLRSSSPALRQEDYGMDILYMQEDGVTPLDSSVDRCAWIRLDGSAEGDGDYLVFSNMFTSTISFTVPAAEEGMRWIRLADTASWAEVHGNFWEAEDADVIATNYAVNAWSMVILKEVPELEAVASPVLNPAGASFSGSLVVEASCPTAGAVIRYTADGSEPESTSAVFPSGGLTLSATTALRVRAWADGMAPSAEVQGSYTLSAPLAPEDPYGVMLQAFTWDGADGARYEDLAAKASQIKDTFEYVWFPPPSDAGSSQGYLPRRLNVLDSSWGTEAELRAAIAALSPAKAIADVVANHRVGTAAWGDFTEPAWDDPLEYYAIASDDEGFTNAASEMFGSAAMGAADTGEGYDAARDLDHTNATVQTGIVSWMNGRLRDAGFVGWRWDYAKGFGGQYLGLYNELADGAFSVGEYWPSDPFVAGSSADWAAEISAWVAATDDVVDSTTGRKSRAFDFVLKGNMNNAFGWRSATDPTAYLGLWNLALLADANNLFRSDPASAVTFIDNHDTGSTQQHWELDPGDLVPAYAFLLTHPGYPCVAWQHYFTGSGSQYQAGTASQVIDMGVSATYTLRQHIDRLMALRSSLKLGFDSAVSVLSSTTGSYAARITSADAGGGEIIVAIGNGWTPAALAGYTGNTPVYSGTNFAIWQKDVTGGGKASITFYFKRPAWVNNGVALYTDGNGTAWAGQSMAACATAQWHKATVSVIDAALPITYQPRMTQDASTKYMKAVNDLLHDAVITAPGGFVVVDASSDATLQWSAGGSDFCLNSSGLITTPSTDPAY